MTPDQSALLQKARDSLDAARLLAKESYWDFSISRSYYAMFYVALAFLLGENLYFSKHSAVIAAFGKHFVKTDRIQAKYHRYLIESHERRNVGDYSGTSELSGTEASEQIRHAEEFLNLAEHLK
ncbi:HEPN domain-containing protein [candidate division WOR-3 bacterium]|uniref:HEPN domain-containing protein n=1 Tax=candidate division WOR-3 bacterium TaxID=2052148 RepID=A0A9D5QCT6_UNCW3|nr:HEPN domain-containing protein [candidate division WOR-3 bacterium]MBD3364331.1 HEPN domain-containing protein [candidate division WOR-3 bacterium]